ncbi:MAG: hypothetical protein JWO03_1403 [Bacteroidetes bacterium]|nr:hypothetical protein [Bacteroidota bacterium]
MTEGLVIFFKLIVYYIAYPFSTAESVQQQAITANGWMVFISTTNIILFGYCGNGLKGVAKISVKGYL